MRYEFEGCRRELFNESEAYTFSLVAFVVYPTGSTVASITWNVMCWIPTSFIENFLCLLCSNLQVNKNSNSSWRAKCRPLQVTTNLFPLCHLAETHQESNMSRCHFRNTNVYNSNCCLPGLWKVSPLSLQNFKWTWNTIKPNQKHSEKLTLNQRTSVVSWRGNY